MRTSHNGAKVRGVFRSQWLLVAGIAVALGTLAGAQQSKSAPAQPIVSGQYEGTAKNSAGEVIDVKLELTEKEGAISGMIRSSHGDFTITGGSHHGEEVRLEFDAGGPTGTISLKTADDKLSGTWSAGDDGGPVSVKKVAAQQGGEKEKS